MFDLNQENILACADYVESLPPGEDDQSKTYFCNGDPSCLIAHLLKFFGSAADPDDPRQAKEGTAELLSIDYCNTHSLYMGFPFGATADNPRPTPMEAAMVLRRLAADQGATWRRESQDTDIV